MLILHETYDHWSVDILTVTVHSSFVPTFNFFFKYVAFCTGFNLLTLIFMLPYLIIDVPIFVNLGSLYFILLHFASIRLAAGLWAELFNNFGELFHNFGKLFHNFGELSNNFGELFHIIGELLTNWVLAVLEDLVNFCKFRVILLHLD